MSLLKSLKRKIKEVEVALANRASAGNPYERYRDDPEGFARGVLKVRLTPAQKQVAELLLVPPYRVLAPAANEVGKTFLAGVITLWWHCTRSPAIIVTTAPKLDQVRDLLWKEIRRLARTAHLNIPFQPKACRIERAADDFAVGTTAKDATGFQGQHGPNQLFVFDESTGVEAAFWEATETMFSPPGHAWLCIFNPTDPSSHAAMEYQNATTRDGGRRWHIVRMSAIDHPNLSAELKGETPPFPHAIRLATFERRLNSWSQLVHGDARPGDITWPPPWAKEYSAKTGRQPRIYRPGPLAESRLLGEYPSQAECSIWGSGDWRVACREGMPPLPLDMNVIPAVGVDVARYGSDWTEIHARQGWCSLSHEAYNGLSTVETAGRVRRLCEKLAKDWNVVQEKRPASDKRRLIVGTDILVNVDDTGVGGGVTDLLESQGQAVCGINSQNRPNDPSAYDKRRSELLFVTAELAREGNLDLSRLPSETLDELKGQAMAVRYKLDAAGRRCAEAKDEVKKRISRSPDGIDALGLAYFSTGFGEMPEAFGGPASPHGRR